MYQILKTWRIKKQKIQLLQLCGKKYLKDESGQCEIEGDEDKIIKHIDFRIKKIYNHKPKAGTIERNRCEREFRKNWPWSRNFKSEGNKL